MSDLTAEYWKAEHLACNAENDRLRAALIAAMEIVQRERVRVAENLYYGEMMIVHEGRIADLAMIDRVIAQADAAMGIER